MRRVWDNVWCFVVAVLAWSVAPIVPTQATGRSITTHGVPVGVQVRVYGSRWAVSLDSLQRFVHVGVARRLCLNDILRWPRRRRIWWRYEHWIGVLFGRPLKSGTLARLGGGTRRMIGTLLLIVSCLNLSLMWTRMTMIIKHPMVQCRVDMRSRRCWWSHFINERCVGQSPKIRVKRISCGAHCMYRRRSWGLSDVESADRRGLTVRKIGIAVRIVLGSVAACGFDVRSEVYMLALEISE